MIRFLFNDELVCLDDCSPDTTVLEYLRTIAEQRGTKEGCASGDCGACTVVIAEAIDGQLRYSNVNSCITFLGGLHGKQLLTVEHLQQSGALHPVQQAMVDLHGSQCGFCTPGFIMSMFALYKNTHSPSRAEVERGLAGNLCRCTGYRPIIDAALSLAGKNGQDQFTDLEQSTLERLTTLVSETPTGQLTYRGRHFFVPTSSDELASLLLTYPDAKLVAGGTDLALSVTQQLQQPNVLIYTGRVAELLTITDSDAALTLGAGVSYSEAEPLLHQHFPAFAELLDRLGSLQVRNQGTLGGNVANASPIGDTPPVLLALNAVLHVRTGDQRQSIGIDDFFLGYRHTALPEGGFIERIEIPKQPDQQLSVFKVSKRLDDDISAVCAALALVIEEGHVRAARLGFGGMAATPARALKAEQALIGQPFTEAGIVAAQQALAQDFQPIDDVRATGTYRLTVAQNLLLRAVYEQGADKEQTMEVVQYA